MPLSRLGIRNVAEAASGLGIPLSIVGAASLYAYEAGASAGGRPRPESVQGALAASVIAAGATVHYPTILVYRDRHILGGAIAGYRTAETYRRVIAERLGSGRQVAAARQPETAAAAAEARGPAGNAPAIDPTPRAPGRWTDFAAVGTPGAYFRWVPGHDVLAYESDLTIYLVDLNSGATTTAPGTIDFIPSPDGRLFVTPAPDRAGLQFFSADRVIEAARRGAGRAVEPIYEDPLMRDQYPSVGILGRRIHRSGPVTTYRVLTSWYAGLIFRDYQVRRPPYGPPEVRALGDPVIACPELHLSIPILSPDGSEIAARDEASATTKIFHVDADGECREVIDLGLPTGKLAFAPRGRRVAFAIPRGAVRDGRGTVWVGTDAAPVLAGIFVLDRERLRITRVPGSQAVDRLAFPEFAGQDRVVFSIVAANGSTRFRLVCCVP